MNAPLRTSPVMGLPSDTVLVTYYKLGSSAELKELLVQQYTLNV